MQNPIIQAVATQAAATDYPISGITVLAPAITGLPILAINWAAFENERSAGLAEGVQAIVLDRTPATVIGLPAMVDAQGLVIAAAWAHGAWDISRTTIAPGHTGALPPYLRHIDAEVRAQGYIAWYWRPMLRSPEIRGKQKRVDITLDRWTRGRSEPPPPLKIPAIRPNQHTVIRLGKVAQAAPAGPRPKRIPRATPSQIGYLVALRREAGEDARLPEGMTIREASDMIREYKARKK